MKCTIVKMDQLPSIEQHFLAFNIILLSMAYSNANYLISPSRLSTKVHHAPGGASSLSLAWDDTPAPIRQNSKVIKAIEPTPYKLKSQPPQNHEAPSQWMRQEQMPQKNYYEPLYPGYLDLNESNIILEEELRFYQNRNKMLRRNLYGDRQNTETIKNYSMNAPQHLNIYPQTNRYLGENAMSYSQNYSQNFERPARQREELDMAILQQQKRRAYERQESYYNWYSAASIGQTGPNLQQKTSVKVSNPPGGRSSIVFG